MPADEHGYGPLTPFGHYETHWNVWPTEIDEEFESKSEEVAPPKSETPSADTLPPPDGEIPPSPSGGATTDPLGDLLLPAPDTNPKAAPLPDTAPGQPMSPNSAPEIPSANPPAITPPEKPADGADLPKTTLPPLPDTDALKPAGELLPESLLPKDEAPMSPKTDEEKKTRPIEPPKQSRTRQSDPRGSRLSASRGRGTPELAFPENRVHKASADVSPGSRPSTGGSGWRGKSTGATMQQEDSGAKWQGRRMTTPSANRQASHLQDIDRPAATNRSATVEPEGGASATGNPLR